MSSVVFSAIAIIGIFFNLAIVVLLLAHGFLRSYSLLFALNLVQPFITYIEWALLGDADRNTPFYRTIYWSAEVVWDLLLFVLVADLIQRVFRGRPEWAMARKILILVVVGVILLPFPLYYQRHWFSSPWFAGASQLFNFGAAALNLVLWGALITGQNRETRLMLVCSGLGVNVAGAAFAWGIRQLAQGPGLAGQVRFGADLFASLTYLLGLLIWCYAFRNRDVSLPNAKDDARAA